MNNEMIRTIAKHADGCSYEKGWPTYIDSLIFIALRCQRAWWNWEKPVSPLTEEDRHIFLDRGSKRWFAEHNRGITPAQSLAAAIIYQRNLNT